MDVTDLIPAIEKGITDRQASLTSAEALAIVILNKEVRNLQAFLRTFEAFTEETSTRVLGRISMTPEQLVNHLANLDEGVSLRTVEIVTFDPKQL